MAWQLSPALRAARRGGQAAYSVQQRKTFSSELSIQHSTLQRITTLRIRSMKNSKNSTRNDCRAAGPGVPGDRGLRGPWEPGDPGPDQRGTRTDADIQNHILRVPMPGDRVSGMEVEVRRARPDDPDPGVGRHLRGDGEGTTVRGEERQAARSGVRRARPDDPEPGVGRHLRGDGEGTVDVGEERQAARRSGVRARPEDNFWYLHSSLEYHILCQDAPCSRSH